MQEETKHCQSCKKDFIVEPEDFSFYEKIKVPPPTFCSECRMIRRLTWRNERTLYKNKCHLCNKNLVSIYDPLGPIVTYCLNCFYGDQWDSLEYGMEYDFSKPFLNQFQELFLKVPKIATQMSSDVINSDYSNHLGSCKNCYLVFASMSDEDCMYCTHINNSKNLLDSHTLNKSELCYECYNCNDSYNLKFSTQSQNCMDSWFLFNCRNCSNCFMCSNLISKSYCINNTQYSKEEYFDLINEIETGSYEVLNNNVKEFKQLKIKAIRKGTESINSIDSSGSSLRSTKNCKKCFDVLNGEDLKFVGYSGDSKNVMDGYAVYPKTELCYEVVASGLNSSNNFFCYLAWDGAFDLRYSTFALPNCNNCFGCTQIRNKSYCILNHQYTKEQYEEMIPKIIKHMSDMPYIDSKGRVYKYGEFFPSELSPFAYNETIAGEYFPLTKEQALEQGFKWKDREARNYTIDIPSKFIIDNIKDIQDEDILNKVIECEHLGLCNQQCTEAFKIIPEELAFYRRMNLPIPRLCPNCRHYERLLQRNPMKLWHRQCMNKNCTNTFETSYSPERPEIVYCEKCYQGEVV